MTSGLRPHWISVVAFSLWAIVGGFLLMQFVIWQWFDALPFSTPTGVRLVGPQSVTRAGSIEIERTVCITHAGAPAIRHVVWTLAGNGAFRAPAVEGLTGAVGCRTLRVLYPVPDDIPPGRYTVQTSWSVPLNPLRRAMIEGGAVEVEVTP